MISPGKIGMAALALSASVGAMAAEVTAVQSLQQGSALVTFDTASPGTIIRQVPLTGLPVGARLIGFDARPAANRLLYGISNTGQVYVINGTTGVANALGAPLALTGFPANAGFDFNPSVDRIRIVTDADENFRVNPDTGAIAAVDPNVAYAAGDSGAGLNPAITGAAYTNNVAGGTPTVLYLIDTNRAVLVTQGNISGTVSPNSGQLFTVGPIGVATNASTGFDISRTGETVAVLTNTLTGAQGLYSINLTTGAATLIGALPTVAGATYTGLAFTQRPLGLVGATANQRAVGTALDRFTGVPGTDLVGLFGGLDSLATDADRADALGQLGPASFAILPELVIQSANFQDTTIRRYLRDARAGGTGSDDTTALVGADRRVGMFLVANGRTGRFDADIDRNRTEYGAAGVIAGLDFRITPTILIGVTGGYDAAEARLNNRSQQSDIDSWFAGAYATVGVGPFYIDAHGSFGRTDFDLRRTVSIGTFSANTRAQPRSENVTAAATAGLSLQFGGLEVEPYGGARYVRVKLDGFSEGTGLTALTVSRSEVESLQSIAGLRLGASVPVGGGSAVLRATVRGEWRHEFENDRSRLIVANFNGAGIGTPFAFQTTPFNDDFAAVGAGFTVSGRSPLSLVVDYSGEIGPDRSIHGITGGLRLTF
jgi:uncharacterized protein with beta-barrel porin domain